MAFRSIKIYQEKVNVKKLIKLIITGEASFNYRCP